MSAVAEAVEAATVILVRAVRNTDAPWECFMVRRHVRSDFASDVFVFPGGKVDQTDLDTRGALYSTRAWASGSLHDDRHWAALRMAAIRELFEEAGVLLAEREEEGPLRLEGDEDDGFAHHRRLIHDGTLSMIELAKRERLLYQFDSIKPLSRWITPDTLPRRFDTYFFVALLPDGQRASHDQRETTAGVWIAPEEALRRYCRGEFPLVFATEKHLELLTRYPSVEALMQAAQNSNLNPIMPKIVAKDGETMFLLPGDEGY